MFKPAGCRFQGQTLSGYLDAKTPMTSDKKSGWDCQFCAEKLSQHPFSGWERLLYVVPIRRFRCSHCFNIYLKPASLVAGIPFVGKLFCEKRGVMPRLRAQLRSRRRNRPQHGDVGLLMRVGTGMSYLDSSISIGVRRIFRVLWIGCRWPFHRFVKTFQRSRKSKSRRRH